LPENSFGEKMESEIFGRLLKAGINSIATCEGKTAPIIEDELGAAIGVTGHSIQRYKVGHIPPDVKTLEIIAEAAVKRGFLNRDWLQRFLHAGRYPYPDKLIQKLFPQISERPRPDRVYHNLPTPTYGKFVMREKPFNDLVVGLQQRVAIVLVVSLGGMGKTCIARETAQQCLYGEGEYPKFDAVVWISDKGREGTTTLNLLLDEICRTLDYPGFTSFQFDDKKIEVENLLRRQRVLLVVDNFETITDSALAQWLIRLPEPSKAVVTSREYMRAFRNCTYVIELHGMEDDEIRELVANRLKMLGLEKYMADVSQLDPLIQICGGNPMAIEIALGYIKYEHKTIHEITDEIYESRGELFEYLFARCWQLLSHEDRSVLFAMQLFPFGAYPDALLAVSGSKGFSFDNSITHLTELSLIDINQDDLLSKPQYSLHSLVKAFVNSKIKEVAGFELEARGRWIKWYSDLASRIGFCWNDIDRLNLLDPKGERENIEAVLDWALENKRYEEIIQITRDIRYYYYVRGIWSTSINILRAEVARKANNADVEFEALVYHINIASKQNNIQEVEKYLPRLMELAENNEMSADNLVDFRHASALYYLARQEYDTALQLWKENLSRGNLSPHASNANRRWMAVCLQEKGQLNEAAKLFDEVLTDAQKQDFVRGVVSVETHLAFIALDQFDLDGAEKRLSHALHHAKEIKDKRAIAELNHLYARFYIKKQDIYTAKEALEIAIDGFERLGLQNKLIEVREMMASLSSP